LTGICFGGSKTEKTGFLRISFFLCFPEEFSQERGFGGWKGLQEFLFLDTITGFFAGIPAGQEFLFLLRIPPDSSGFLRIPVPAKSCLA